MTIVKAIFSNFTAFLMAIILTVVPYKGIELPIIDTSADNCKLTLEMISDTHVEKNEPFRKAFLKAALKNISNAKCNVDAMIVAGDITNYADEPSLAKYYDIIKSFKSIPVITAAGNHDIGHAGDRDVTNITREQAKENFIRYSNEYYGTNYETNYYSRILNGYKVIVLGDDLIDGGHFDAMDMSKEQIEFLDNELADATKDGLPVFVVCHWPVDGMNAQDTIWPGSGIDLEKNNIKDIMEKYKNVFYISGHMHAGIKSTIVDEKYGLASVEKVNGVTYITLPTFGIINTFGYPFSGTGMQLEVYENQVVIRPRNFITNKWFTNSAYTISLDK